MFHLRIAAAAAPPRRRAATEKFPEQRIVKEWELLRSAHPARRTDGHHRRRYTVYNVRT